MLSIAYSFIYTICLYYSNDLEPQIFGQNFKFQLATPSDIDVFSIGLHVCSLIHYRYKGPSVLHVIKKKLQKDNVKEYYTF